MADAIESQVIEIVAKKRNLDRARVTLDSTFDELGVDSLDAADLVFTIEDTFGIVVPDEAAQSMKSVRQIVDGVRRLVAARAGA